MGEKMEKFHKELTVKLNDAFQSVLNERVGYYEKNPDKKPQKGGVDSIIKNYSWKNAAITGGISLIPGPLGMVAAVPEIVIIIRNQIAMIYDIGIAMGHEGKISVEVLISVFVAALSNVGVGLVVMHGSKLIVKRAALSVIQKIIKLLAGKITQQALKSMLSKWIPIVGAAAMATWSKVQTDMIGKKAKEMLEKELVHSDEELSEEAVIIPEDLKGAEA